MMNAPQLLCCQLKASWNKHPCSLDLPALAAALVPDGALLLADLDVFTPWHFALVCVAGVQSAMQLESFLNPRYWWIEGQSGGPESDHHACLRRAQASILPV